MRRAWRPSARAIAGWGTGLLAALVEGLLLWSFDLLPTWAQWATIAGAGVLLVAAIALMPFEPSL
jgi:hypothetical protein